MAMWQLYKISTTGNSSACLIVNTTLHSQGYIKAARHYSEQMRAKEHTAFKLVLLIILYRGNVCQSRGLGMYVLLPLLFILQEYAGIPDKFRPP